MDKFNQLPKVVQDCHLLLQWFIPTIEKFPRQRRFTLGEKMENRLITVLELLVEASFARDKKSLLHKANIQLSVLRHLWRLAFELKIAAIKSYKHGAELLLNLGKQVGGWYKTSH